MWEVVWEWGVYDILPRNVILAVQVKVLFILSEKSCVYNDITTQMVDIDYEIRGE